MSSKSPIMDAYESWEEHARSHHAGTFPTDVLRIIETMLPASVQSSAESGCGKSTVLFSNIASQHTVFCLDDREQQADSSVNFYLDCPISRVERIRSVFGPTQVTLPAFAQHQTYDIVMLDGPHGWPFPELEYYFFYPHIAIGGWLILDDCNIPTIGRMADVIAEDEMWSLQGFASTTALFRRTDAPLFDPLGDNWWEQRFNRRRVSPKAEIHLPSSGPIVDRITSLRLSARLYGDEIE